MNAQQFQAILRDREIRAGVILAGFTVGIVAMALFTVVDEVRKGVLEVVIEPSAVGDRHFFPADEAIEVGMEAVRVEDQPYFFIRAKAEKHKDYRMMRLQTVDDSPCFLYRYEPEEDESAESESLRYLRVAPQRFLAVSASPPGKQSI